jgi:hypothetical protein
MDKRLLNGPLPGGVGCYPDRLGKNSLSVRFEIPGLDFDKWSHPVI